MKRAGIGVSELSNMVSITPANISVLKNGRAKAIRFSTLESLCSALECEPGDILKFDAFESDELQKET